MRRILLLGLGVLVVGALGPVTMPNVAQADHPEPVTRHLKVVLDGSRESGDDFKTARRVRDGEERVPAIARNPIAIEQKDEDDATKPKWRIPVCSPPAYRAAVTAAVAVWNAGAGIPLFEMQTSAPAVTYDGMGKVATATSAGCPTTAELEQGKNKYVASVVVAESVDPMALDSTGFATMPTMNEEFHARTGMNLIHVNDDPYRRLKNDKRRIAFFVHELGHTLGFSHPYEPMHYRVPGYTHPTNDGGRYAVVGCPDSFRVIVGETKDAGGNAIAVSPRLEHPVKVVAPTHNPPRWGFLYTPVGGVKEEPVYFTEEDSRILSALSKSTHGGADMIPHPNCWGDRELRFGEWDFTGAVALSQYTKDVYTKVYNPAAATGLTVTAEENSLRFRWNLGHVHVERGFAVQVRVRDTNGVLGWVTVVGTLDDKKEISTLESVIKTRGNTTAHKIVDPPGAGSMEFRVYSQTDAFGGKQPEQNDAPGTGVTGRRGSVIYSTRAVLPPTVTPTPPTVTPTPVKLSTIHLTVTPQGCGTVTWEWDTAADVLQDQTRKLRLHHGSTPTLVASAKSWCTFTGWSGDCSGTSPRCKLKLDSDKTVTAQFQRTQGKLSYEERAALYQAANARHTARMAVAAKALFQCLDDQPANTQPCFDGYQAAFNVSIAIYEADRARIAAMP